MIAPVVQTRIDMRMHEENGLTKARGERKYDLLDLMMNLSYVNQGIAAFTF
jgi:hypothetical protein